MAELSKSLPLKFDISIFFIVFQKDVFDFEAVSIGNVTRIVLEKAAGTPWYLDKLILKEGEFAAMETEFSHNR